MQALVNVLAFGRERWLDLLEAGQTLAFISTFPVVAARVKATDVLRQTLVHVWIIFFVVVVVDRRRDQEARHDLGPRVRPRVSGIAGRLCVTRKRSHIGYANGQTVDPGISIIMIMMAIRMSSKSTSGEKVEVGRNQVGE